MTSLESELTRRYQMAQFFGIIWYGAVLKLDEGEMNSRKSRGKDPVLGSRTVQGLDPHQETERLILGGEERRGWSKLNMEEGNLPPPPQGLADGGEGEEGDDAETAGCPNAPLSPPSPLDCSVETLHPSQVHY